MIHSHLLANHRISVSLVERDEDGTIGDYLRTAADLAVGVGRAKGKNRFKAAAADAIVDLARNKNAKKAKKIILSLELPKSNEKSSAKSMIEVAQIAQTYFTDEDAEVCWGIIENSKKKSIAVVTVIALW